MKNIILLLFFFISTSNYAQTTYSNFDDFKEACAAAQAGDEIILAKGRYEAESITISDVAGTAENPVIIRAEEIGADTLDDATYFDLRHCSYITIQGFVINITEKSTTFKIQTCNNIRITQNILDGTGESYYKDNGVDRNSAVWVSIQSLWDDETGLSHHNRIDHNIFRNKQTLGNMIKIDGTNSLYVSQYDVIEYNYFKNMGPRADNEMEAIRIGWSAMSESDGYCTVSNNLFEECNGDPEIISVKCNKNTVSHNTFLRCQGTLSLRHGNESLVEGNFFLGEGTEGTGGVRIYGSDHRIINNYFEGLTGTKWDAPITLTYGDAEEGSGSLTNHFRIERAIIANNTLVNNHHGIEVGYDNSGKYSKPPRDVIMANNLLTADTNSLVKYINDPINMTWINNLMYTTDDAVVSDGVTLSGDQITEQDPLLTWNEDEGLFRSLAETPAYTASFDLTGEIQYDMDGQLRSASTQYGADEYTTSTVVYHPLTPKDVGVDVGEYLQISAASILFSVNKDTAIVTVSTNMNWEASADISWITLEEAQGSGDGFVRIIADKNESGIIRTGSVILESTNSEESTEIVKTINVTQAEKDPPSLEISATELNFNSDAGQKTITITSNVDWTSASNADWITLNPESASNTGDLTVNVEENESRSGRNALITISDGAALTHEVIISQTGSLGTEEKLIIKDAIASTEQAEKGNIADNVYDGILTNRWSGDGDGAYIDLLLEDSSRISFIKIGLYKGSERNSYFDLQSSVDGINYFDLLTDITSEITEETLVLYDFQDTTANFVRLVGHGNSTSTWNSYTEFEVWGWSLGTPDTTTIDTSTTDTVSIQQYSDESFKLYPNPSNGTFTIESEPGSIAKVYDLRGNLLFINPIQEKKKVLETTLPAGCYILRIENQKGYQIKKVLIE